MPSPNAGLSSDVQSLFQKNSPLSLLNLQGAQSPPSTPAILDPQKVANDIAVQRELDRIETEKRANPTPSNISSNADRGGNGVPAPGGAPPVGTDAVQATAEALSQKPAEKAKDGLDTLDSALNGEEPPKVEPPKEGESKEGESTEEDPLADVSDEPKAENFKKLRERTRSYAERLKAATEAHKADRVRLEEYETGAVMPEVLKEKEERIAQLEPLEKIHSLKTSPEYRERFIKPLNHIGSQLQDLSERYQVDAEVAHHALGIRNERDLDEFLVEHFGNTVGAVEAKQLIQNAQHIQAEAYEAEAEPGSALQRLTQDAERTRVAEETNRIESIKHVARSSWMDAVQQIREEGIAKELIPGDAIHNERFVTPIQTAASSEFGKIMVALAGAGAKEIPADVGKALARMSLLAHTSAVNQARAIAAEAHIAELEKNTERNNHIYRPSLSGGGTGALGGSPGGASSAPKPADPVSTARTQLQDMGLAPRR